MNKERKAPRLEALLPAMQAMESGLNKVETYLASRVKEFREIFRDNYQSDRAISYHQKTKERTKELAENASAGKRWPIIYSKFYAEKLPH